MNRLALIIILGLLTTANVCLANADLSIAVFEDESAAVSFQEVQTTKFTPIDKEALSFGFSSSAYWLEMHFDLAIGKGEGQILSICYTQLDDVQAFIHKNAQWVEIKTGDKKPFTSRDIKHPCFAFDLSEADMSPLYLRVSSSGFVKIPLIVKPSEEFWQQGQVEQLGSGFYFAFLLAMFIYNLFLFFVVRENGYLYYVAYLGSISLFLASMSGHTAMYLWPNSTIWGNLAPVIFATFTISFALLFVRNMTRISHYYQELHKGMGIALIGIILVFAGLLLSSRFGIIMLGVYMLLCFALMTWAILIAVSKRWPPAYFLFVGLMLMIPGGVIYFSRVMGILDEGWLSNNILRITSVIEAMLLSFALAYRIRMLNTEIENHQQQAIIAQSKFSRSLLKAADYERRAIARELHDNFGQGLLVIKNAVNRLSFGEQRQQIVAQLKGLISDTRNMARNMHPQQVETLGFATALETMLSETMALSNLKLTLSLDDMSGLIDKDAELHLYRIAQESASNIIKHARAKEVDVSLTVAKNTLTLRISDDGVGIHKEAGRGMGILNMQERAAIIGANFVMQLREPNGTDILVEVPIQ